MGLLRRLAGGERRPPPAAAPTRETLAGWVREAYDLLAQGKPGESRALFQKVLEHDQRHPEALYFLGSVASEDGRHLEATHYYMRAVDARPNDAAFWFVLAGALFNLGRYSDSIPAFQGGLALHPKSIDMAGALWVGVRSSRYTGGERPAVQAA